MELCKQEVKVRSDRFGCYMYRNFALQHFVKRRNDWLGIQESDMRKRKLFKDFLDDKTGAGNYTITDMYFLHLFLLIYDLRFTI